MYFSTEDSLYDVFEREVCENCHAAKEDCYAGDHKLCRFWGDFENLRDMCQEVDEFIDLVAKDARNYDIEDDRLAYENV